MYETIFSIEDSIAFEQLVGWSTLAMGIVFFLISLAFRIAARTGYIVKGVFPMWLGTLALMTGAVISLLIRNSGNYGRIVLSLDSAAVVEGKVDRFDVRPKEGHTMGLISINREAFPYESYSITRALWQAAEPRGRLGVGCRVRLWFIGHEILKVATEPRCASPEAKRNGSGP